MSVELDLSNAENWEDVYSTSQAITQLGPRSYVPLSEIQVPILLTKPILAVYCESPSAPPHWKRAGWLNQQIRVGITVGGGQEGNRQKGYLLLLKKIMVIEWEPFAEAYQVSFTPQRYLDDISLRIWEYTGPITQSLDEKIDLTRIDVLRLEKQVQFIASRDVETNYRVE